MTKPWKKVVVITGAAMGMGREMAFLFGREGAKLALWDANREKLNQTMEELKHHEIDARFYKVDVTDTEKVKNTVEAVHREVGKVDILVNNAGVVYAGHFLDVDMEKHKKTTSVNIKGVLICTHAILPDMMEKKAGHIVNMASAAGLLAVPGVSAYTASKFAVVGFTEALRMELRKMGMKKIRTTTVCPSTVTTGMFEGMKVPKMSSALKPYDMALKIFEGVKKNKVYVKAPFMVHTIPISKALLPPAGVDKLAEMTGVHTSMDTWVGRGRQ